MRSGLFFLVSLFVRSEGRFFVPTCPAPVTPSAVAVKDGRRRADAPSSGVARPRLDGGEHGVTLGVVGTAAMRSNTLSPGGSARPGIVASPAGLFTATKSSS